MSEPVALYNTKVKDHSKEAAHINNKLIDYPKMPEAIQILKKNILLLLMVMNK